MNLKLILDLSCIFQAIFMYLFNMRTITFPILKLGWNLFHRMSRYCKINNYELRGTLHFQPVINEQFFMEYISNSIRLLVFVFASLLFMIQMYHSIFLFFSDLEVKFSKADVSLATDYSVSIDILYTILLPYFKTRYY